MSKVGSKGELFLPAALRKELGLEPGMKILFFIHNGRLVVEPIPEISEILNQRKDLKAISMEELKNERRALSKSLEG